MNNIELIERIESLESRLMHQDASIDEMTHTLLLQEQMIYRQQKAIEHLESQLRSLSVTRSSPPENEPPPPHY